MAKTKKDRSAELGLGGTATGASVAGGTLYALTGGSASASAITYALAAIGGYFGGEIAAGLAAVIGGPVALGLGGYAIGKGISSNHNLWPINNQNSRNNRSTTTTKNLDKKRQPLAQAYKKEYLLNKAQDFASNYLGANRQISSEITRSEDIYTTFLDTNNLKNTLDNSSASYFSKRIEGLLKVVQDKTLSDKNRDRILLLIGWLTLVYYLVHFCDVSSAGQEDAMYDLLDLIDGYVGAMSYRTPEALYLYYVANMFSADRIENSVPSAKLREFRQKLSQIQMDEDHTEFSPSGWKELEDLVYGIMKRIIN